MYQIIKNIRKLWKKIDVIDMFLKGGYPDPVINNDDEIKLLSERIIQVPASYL